MNQRGLTAGVVWMRARAAGLAAACVALGLALPRGAGASVASDRPAAIVVFPKIVVDTANGTDTLIRLSNASNDEQPAICYYVNATPICVGGQPGETCFPDPAGCSGVCEPQWQETDFRIVLTALQPTAWLASQGQRDCPVTGGQGLCSEDGTTSCQSDADCAERCVFPPCFPLDGFFREGPRGQSNFGSAVPPVPEDPFIGELKCVAVDQTDSPVARNSLKGEAMIGLVPQQGAPGGLARAQLAGYNAIGIPAVPDRNDRDNTLVLGGPDAEYEGCPNILILDHFFDGAEDPVARNLCRSGSCTVTGDTCTTDADCEAVFDGVRVATDLTLVPCTQDFREQDPSRGQTVAQVLVFNEFEQRFSTSRTVTCFREFRLSNLDTFQNERSIFSAGVAGTMTGQTRIRGVDVGAPDGGNTLLGVAEEFRCHGADFPSCSFTRPSGLVGAAAGNLHAQGTRARSDFIYLP